MAVSREEKKKGGTVFIFLVAENSKEKERVCLSKTKGRKERRKREFSLRVRRGKRRSLSFFFRGEKG